MEVMQNLRDLVESVLGTYTPNTVTVNGEIVPLQGLAGVDFAYIFTGAILVIAVFCTFKILGSFISKL